jgi:hypothetical protein
VGDIIKGVIIGVVIAVLGYIFVIRDDHLILKNLKNEVETLKKDVSIGNKDLTNQIENGIHALVAKIETSKDVIENTKKTVAYAHPHLESFLVRLEKMDAKEVDQIITKTQELPENELAKWLVKEKDFSQEDVGNVLSNKLLGYGAITPERLFATCNACHGGKGIGQKTSLELYSRSAKDLKISFEHASSLAKEGAIVAPIIHELTHKYKDHLSIFFKENKDRDN